MLFAGTVTTKCSYYICVHIWPTGDFFINTYTVCANKKDRTEQISLFLV